MKEQLSQDTPTPNRSTKELVELTLRQELIPMPLLTMELPSQTLLIHRLQLSLATLSKSTNGNKAVCKRPCFVFCVDFDFECSVKLLTFAHKKSIL